MAKIRSYLMRKVHRLDCHLVIRSRVCPIRNHAPHIARSLTETRRGTLGTIPFDGHRLEHDLAAIKGFSIFTGSI
jgi:hypothetical protein